VVTTQQASLDARVTAIASDGKAYPIEIKDIPPQDPRGADMNALIGDRGNLQVIAARILDEEGLAQTAILATLQGKIKRLPLAELANLTARGLTIMKLKEGDRLFCALLGQEGEEIMLATSGGRLLRFELNDQQLPAMGRTTQGLQALPLNAETLVGCAIIAAKEVLLLISRLGYVKRIPASAIRLVNRNNIGTQGLRFQHKSDALVVALPVPPSGEVLVQTDLGRLISLKVAEIKLRGTDGKGDRLPQLRPEETIVTAVVV